MGRVEQGGGGHGFDCRRCARYSQIYIDVRCLRGLQGDVECLGLKSGSLDGHVVITWLQAAKAIDAGIVTVGGQCHIRGQTPEFDGCVRDGGLRLVLDDALNVTTELAKADYSGAQKINEQNSFTG